MPNNIKHFDYNQFKSDHWNKKEYFVNNAHELQLNKHLPGLEKLWLDPRVEKRVISHQNNEFTYEICDFIENIPKEVSTTVFVQNIDKYFPSLSCIYDLLSFVPKYRIEDIMLSFSNENGSSGPHVDFYDVFILQIAGTKEWRIEKNLRSYSECGEDHLQENSEIKLLKDFSSECQSYLLKPGDLLYVPSHLAHYATNINSEDSISLSVGLRAPKVKDFIYSTAHSLAEEYSEDHRLSHNYFINQNKYELTKENLSYFNLPLALTNKKSHLLLIELGKLFTENAYWDEGEWDQDISLDPEKIKLKTQTRFCYFSHQDQHYYFFNGEMLQSRFNFIEQLVLYFDQKSDSISLNPNDPEQEDVIQFMIDNDLIEFP